MTTIYLITSGEYSDYSINAVFTTKELAEQYRTFFGGDIEEWEADRMADDLRAGKVVYQVYMYRDGSTECFGVTAYNDEIPFTPKHHVQLLPNPDRMVTYVKAKSREHAVKVANERRTHLIASGGWPIK